MHLISLLWFIPDITLLNQTIHHTLNMYDDSHICKHICESFNGFDRKTIENKQKVIINPIRHNLNKYKSLSFVHYDNYKYSKTKTDFEYISLMCNNELLYRIGVNQYITQYDALVKCSSNDSYTSQLLERHPTFRQLVKDFNVDIKCSTQEGCSFKTELFKEMFLIINKYLPTNHIYDDGCILDETLLATTASILTDKISNPYTKLILDRPININDLTDDFFSIKRVEYNVNDSIRKHIINLHI